MEKLNYKLNYDVSKVNRFGLRGERILELVDFVSKQDIKEIEKNMICNILTNNIDLNTHLKYRESEMYLRCNQYIQDLISNYT